MGRDEGGLESSLNFSSGLGLGDIVQQCSGEEGGDGFLLEAMKIKSTSCSTYMGNFAVKLVQRFFSSQEGLLKLLQDEFDFTKWLLTKQDNKMVVIRRSNVTVNWYKLRLCNCRDRTIRWLSDPFSCSSQKQITTAVTLILKPMEVLLESKAISCKLNFT